MPLRPPAVWSTHWPGRTIVRVSPGVGVVQLQLVAEGLDEAGARGLGLGRESTDVEVADREYGHEAAGYGKRVPHLARGDETHGAEDQLAEIGQGLL